jgi:hypothetical protein
MIYMGGAEDYEQEQVMEVEALQAIVLPDAASSPPRRHVLAAVHHRSICRLIPRSSQHHGSRQEKWEGTSG